MSTHSKDAISDPFGELRDVLSSVERPGNFYSEGEITTPIPRLDVEGLGTVAFPLQRAQADELIGLAERAPYGRGSKTLVDTLVRSTWQLGPDQFQVLGAEWEKTLGEIVRRVARDLGCSGDVSAEIYKLLLYDRGSFFLEHRDSEKAEGMFGTLVVLLPSQFQGGELVVRHAGREAVLDLGGEDVSRVTYAAFYADCVHELRPIREGYRLGLVYNLVRRGAGDTPRPPEYGSQQEAAYVILERWSKALEDEGGASAESGDALLPDKLLYVLEHHYTSAGLAFASLKGGDAAVAAVLQGAAQKADCAFQLAMVSIHERGSAEERYYGRRRYGRGADDDQGDFNVIEVIERTQQVEHWRDADDRPLELPPVAFEEEELCPADALKDEKPDEQHYQEASGNEGANFERTYRRAALVLWPRHHAMAVMAQAGREASIAYLNVLMGRARRDPPSQELTDARRLAIVLIDRWPMGGDETWNSDRLQGPMLAALNRLGEAELVERFMRQVICAGRYEGRSNEALRASRGILGWEQVTPLLVQLMRHSMARAFNQCIQLFELLTQDLEQGTGGATALRAIAGALVEELPPKPVTGTEIRELTQWDSARRGQVVGSPDLVITLFRALWRVGDEAIVRTALKQIEQHPETYSLDSVLLPAALVLRSGSASTGPKRLGLEKLERFALAGLRTRAALPLDPPTNWAQSAKLSCTCADCKAAQAFLADPKAQVWSLKAIEHRRRHVEATVHGLDVDCRTERKGSPHQLVITKNRKSYEARCEQRRRDLEAIATLARAPS